jgi:hypothetical protein
MNLMDEKRFGYGTLMKLENFGVKSAEFPPFHYQTVSKKQQND